VIHHEVAFERGDKVRVVEGPYRGFEGLVDEAQPERRRMDVVVRVHGRLARLEFTYGQVRPL
jgi:transcriptional antiterminator NusG